MSAHTDLSQKPVVELRLLAESDDLELSRRAAEALKSQCSGEIPPSDFAALTANSTICPA